MSNKKELGDMCALILNELFDTTMTSNQYHSKRSGSYFFNHKHIQCIEVTNSKGYLDKMGADYKCPIKIKTVKGLRPIDLNLERYYLHKTVKDRGGRTTYPINYVCDEYGGRCTKPEDGGRSRAFHTKEVELLTSREVLHRWESAHYDYFDTKLHDLSPSRMDLVEDPQKDPRIADNIYTDFQKKYYHSDKKRRELHKCFRHEDMEHTRNLIMETIDSSNGLLWDDWRVHVAYLTNDDIHTYKFYCEYTGQFIFSITLFDFSNWWFTSGEDPRTKTTRGFVAVTVGVSLDSTIDYANNSQKPWRDTNEWSVHDNLRSESTFDIMRASNSTNKTKTELVFGCGINAPIYPKRKSKQTKAWLRGNRYDDFTKSMQGGNTHLHYQRHLVCQIQKVQELVEPMVSAWLTDSCEYHNLKWNGVEPIHSKESLVETDQVYVPPKDPDYHKAVYLMYSKYNARHVFKENPHTAKPPKPEAIRDLISQTASFSVDYAREVKAYLNQYGGDAYPNNTDICHSFVDPNVISEKAVECYNRLESSKQELATAQQEYTAKVCITVNPVTGQVYTGDSFNQDKYNELFARTCMFSRGKIDQLQRYFLDGIQRCITDQPTEVFDKVREALNHATKYKALKMIDLKYIPENVATYLYLTETCSLYNTYNSIEQFAEMHEDWYGIMCMLDFAIPDEASPDEGLAHCVPYVGSKIVVPKRYKSWQVASLSDIAMRDHFTKSFYYIYTKEGEVI